MLRLTTWHVPGKLNLDAMREGAKHFIGKRDFMSLAATRHYQPETTVRTLTRCDLRRSGPLFTFIIEGDGFLYRMCRGIAGTLVQVGQGKIRPEEIPGILEGKDRELAGMSAPAHGLVLWKVFY